MAGKPKDSPKEKLTKFIWLVVAFIFFALAVGWYVYASVTHDSRGLGTMFGLLFFAFMFFVIAMQI